MARLRSDFPELLTIDVLRSFNDEFDVIEAVFEEESLEEIDELSPEEFEALVEDVDNKIKAGLGATLSQIAAAIEVIDKHEDALAYDCMVVGTRLRYLGTDRLTWGDLVTIIQQSPRSSALYRAMEPENSLWGISEHMLATIADALHAANWQRAEGKKKDYPKPIPRPGVEDPGKKYGKGAVSLDEMAEWLKNSVATE